MDPLNRRLPCVYGRYTKRICFFLSTVSRKLVKSKVDSAFSLSCTLNMRRHGVKNAPATCIFCTQRKARIVGITYDAH